MSIQLSDHQIDAIDKLKVGSILCGGVGSGKSRTGIAYYFTYCGGRMKINGVGETRGMTHARDLYIITTAKKRDSLEWEEECLPFLINKKRELSINNVKVTVDSWNNLKKYIGVKDAFFIFDEQRVVGSGTWVKSFLKITPNNPWIILTATPGDTWSDYIPLFLANGFYKNRTEFLRTHAVFSRFTKYPQIEQYIGCRRLAQHRDAITVIMPFTRHTTSHQVIVNVEYDKEFTKLVRKKRWNPFTDKPMKTAGELCYVERKIVNSDPSRVAAMHKILVERPKVIIFYNFDYELVLLRELCSSMDLTFAEWNGHLHQEVPDTERWAYLVQYTAGAEGWNCITTDTTVFFSQSYSYKTMEQASGRIDRLNTKFYDLYYYHLRSYAPIDLAIAMSLKRKKNFNAYAYSKNTTSREKHRL